MSIMVDVLVIISLSIALCAVGVLYMLCIVRVVCVRLCDKWYAVWVMWVFCVVCVVCALRVRCVACVLYVLCFMRAICNDIGSSSTKTQLHAQLQHTESSTLSGSQ